MKYNVIHRGHEEVDGKIVHTNDVVATLETEMDAGQLQGIFRSGAFKFEAPASKQAKKVGAAETK